MRPTQYFTDEYLQSTRKSTPTQIAKFLDDYRILHGNAKLEVTRKKTKLISIRLTVDILSDLKSLSKRRQIPYQTLMKQLLEQGLNALSQKVIASAHSMACDQHDGPF